MSPLKRFRCIRKVLAVIPLFIRYTPRFAPALGLTNQVLDKWFYANELAWFQEGSETHNLQSGTLPVPSFSIFVVKEFFLNLGSQQPCSKVALAFRKREAYLWGKQNGLLVINNRFPNFYIKFIFIQVSPLKVVKPGFTGLLNLGNTCYLNSVLQVLVNTCELKYYFLSEFSFFMKFYFYL